MKEDIMGPSKTRINILITSASKKIPLLKGFKKALRDEKTEGKIITIDVDRFAPALYISDSGYIVPKTDDRIFLDFLKEICKKENINLLIPTRDMELKFYSSKKNIIKKWSVEVIVSNRNTIDICNNKHKTFQFFQKNNLPTPMTYLPHEAKKLKYPLIIKNKYGAGTRELKIVNSKEGLRQSFKDPKNLILQEYVKGIEYTIDTYTTLKGKFIGAIPRKRVEVVDGESKKSTTVYDSEMIKYARIIAANLDTRGHINIQCIKTEKGLKFIEINPRFGGASALSFKAGLNSPKFLIREILQRPVCPISKYVVGLSMLRYPSDIFVKNIEIQDRIKLILFDLDETLYDEKSYVLSGFRVISKYLSIKHKIDEKSLFNELVQSLEKKGRGENFDILLKKFKLIDSVSDMVRIYRQHKPKIKLFPEVMELLKKLSSFFKIGIITDGNLIMQENKITALKLYKAVDFIIYTDKNKLKEKPDISSFKKALTIAKCTANESIYIGDNPYKDFIGAKSLGIKTIRIKRGEYENIVLSKKYEADITIEGLSNLSGLLFNYQISK